MKRRMAILVLCFMFFSNLKVYAVSGPEIEAVVNGTIDKGQTIQILINIKDIQSFFAGAIKFKYDKNVLKIKSIEGGNLISKAGINKFEAINKIDEQNGIAAYGFSCTGKINGYSGTGTFIRINAEVLKKDSFHIKSKPLLDEPNDDFNLKLQICDSNIKEVEYNFKSYEFNLNEATVNNSDINKSTENLSQNSSKENSSVIDNTNKSTSSDSKDNSADNTSQKNNNVKKSDTKNKSVDVSNKIGDTKKDTIVSANNNNNIEDKNKSKTALAISIATLFVIASVMGYVVYKRKRKV